MRGCVSCGFGCKVWLVVIRRQRGVRLGDLLHQPRTAHPQPPCLGSTLLVRRRYSDEHVFVFVFDLLLWGVDGARLRGGVQCACLVAVLDAEGVEQGVLPGPHPFADGPCMLVCCDPGVALVFGLVCEFVLPSRVCVGGGPVRGREGGQVAELIARRHQVEVKVVNVHLRQGRESLEHSLHG